MCTFNKISKYAILMEEYKILIVDDYTEQIMVIKEILMRDSPNYQILTASNGKIAIDTAKMELPHLIIMDWDMPIMNGVEATERLKNDAITKNIPIIISSGMHTDSGAIEQALSKGAIDFVRKPIDRVELVARVHSMLRFVDSFKELILQKEFNFQQEILHKQNELSSYVLSIAQQNEYLRFVSQELKKLLNIANAKSKKIIFRLN
ncbi:MAG: response regulator [Chloroflexia bacterium]|nr:response regulator [Chloroflexia bacterium]